MCSEKINPLSNTYPWAWLLGALIGFGIVGSLFLFQQSVWTDETTQLKGLTLGPEKVIYWLLGTNFGLGVPLDRMPPLSYWYGQAWSSIFGLSITSMRFSSLFIASLALSLFFHTVYRAFGKQSAILAAFLFVTSPNLIAIAVEIRAYALFLFFSVCALWFLQCIIADRQSIKWNYIGLTLACLGAIYTHFYGIVFSFVIFITLYLALLSSNKSLGRFLLATFSLCVGALVVLPFIVTAFGHPNAFVERVVLREMFRLLYRFLFHAAIDQQLLVLASSLGVLSLLVSLFKCHKSLFRRALGWMIGLGLLLVLALAFFLSAFEAASPAYNIWMLPPVFALLSSSLACTDYKFKSLVMISALLVLLAPLYGDYRLLSQGKFFAHGRYQEVFQLIVEQHPHAAVLYDSSEEYGMPYYALFFLSEGALPQYQVFRAKSGLEVRKIVTEGFGLTLPLNELSMQEIVLIQTKNQSNQQLQEQMRSQAVALEPKEAVTWLMASKEWRLKERKAFLAFSKIEVFVFERN